MYKKSNSGYRIDKDTINNRFMGVDVGTTNLAFSIVERQEKSWSVLYGQMSTLGITNLKTSEDKPKRGGIKPPFLEQLRSLSTEFDNLIKFWRPAGVTIERFQSRGQRNIWSGNSAELCGVTVGLLAMRCRKFKLEPLLITAGEWKNKFKTAAKIDAKGFDEFYKKLPCPNHVTDACLIAMYGGGRMLNLKPFSPYKDFHLNWMKEIILNYKKK